MAAYVEFSEREFFPEDWRGNIADDKPVSNRYQIKKEREERKKILFFRWGSVGVTPLRRLKKINQILFTSPLV